MADPNTSCPTCGAAAERGQLVCLECGSRIALTYRRPPSWKLPLALMVALAVLIGTSAVLAYQAIGEGAEKEVAATPLKPKKPVRRAAKRKAKLKPAPAQTAGLLKKGALYSWPRSYAAFTVVVLSTQDRASATRFAKRVAAARDAKAGVIRADDFKTLPKGFFVVFAGSYATRAKADRAVARLSKTYQGCFAQLVKR